MSIGQTQSVALLGLTGSVVEVEVDISDGIPMYSLLGLPDAARHGKTASLAARQLALC